MIANTYYGELNILYARARCKLDGEFIKVSVCGFLNFAKIAQIKLEYRFPIYSSLLQPKDRSYKQNLLVVMDANFSVFYERVPESHSTLYGGLLLLHSARIQSVLKPAVLYVERHYLQY